jgi:hypothetical protein
MGGRTRLCRGVRVRMGGRRICRLCPWMGSRSVWKEAHLRDAGYYYDFMFIVLLGAWSGKVYVVLEQCELTS